MRYFCTYFNYDFLIRAVSMMDSLYSKDKEVTFYVLSLDKKTFHKLKNMNLSYIKLINNKNFFNIYSQLKKHEHLRKINEFCFLLTPYLIEYCLLYLKIKSIFYTDADLFFFDDCKKITNKLDNYSIICSCHNFNKENKFQEKINGVFNVGFLGFKNDYITKKSLERWKRQCFFSTTTHKSFENVIKGDQLYLNSWPKIFKKNFYPIKNPCFNIGAWNVNNFVFKNIDNEIFYNKKKILMVHANFIEFQNKKKIIIQRRPSQKEINNIIVKSYKNISKKIGIKNFQINKIGNIFFNIQLIYFISRWFFYKRD